MPELKIASEYTKFPGGRYRRHGKGSGEEFRDDYLVPRIKGLENGDKLVVWLDDTAGYPASFLEEAFGGLVRAGFSLQNLRARLALKATDLNYQSYADKAWEYIEDAEQDRVA